MSDQEKLYTLIDKELSHPCEDSYPSICAHLASQQGRNYIRQSVFHIAASEGLSVNQAMAQLESDLPAFE